MLLLPQHRRLRVRGVQVHGESTERAAAGQRVAINLVGVAVEELVRGDALVSPEGGLATTHRIDAALQWERGAEPDSGARVQVHHGTRESAARLAWLGGRFWQIRLEQPLMPRAGDRVVIRQIAPPDTLGGGVVLDASPRRHGPSRELLTRLERLERGEPLVVPESGGDQLRAAHSRVQVGRVELTPTQLALEQRLRDAGLEPPLESELNVDDLAALRAAGRAVRVSKTLHYHPDVLADARRRVLELAACHDGAVTLAQLRDELGTSRKFAQALLEHLDSEKVTIRRGDAHYVRASARTKVPRE